MYSEKLPTIAELCDPSRITYDQMQELIWQDDKVPYTEFIPDLAFSDFFTYERPFVKCCNCFTPQDLVIKFMVYKRQYMTEARNIYNALNAEYNILDNYNGKETHTITERNTKTGGIETTGSNTNNTSTTGENTNNTSTTATGTNTEKVTTFETDTWRTAGGADTTTDSTTTDTTTTSNTLTGTATANSTQTFNNVKDTKNFSETTERAGNLGVTTSQQMVMSELDLRSKYICAKMVVDKFIEVYCI